MAKYDLLLVLLALSLAVVSALPNPTSADDDDDEDDTTPASHDDTRVYKNPRNSPSAQCPRDEEQATLLGQKCLRKCSSDEDCKSKKKKCLCDGACGMSCIKPGQFDILREKCKVMLGSGGEGVSDEQALENVRQLHTMHVNLMKYIQLFSSLLSPVMFFYVVVNSLLLCASAYQITSATSTVQKLLVAEYLIFGIAQLFLFCWHSDGVLVKNEEASYGCYDSEWWGAPLPQRKAASLLMGQLRIIHRFSAGPFTNLSLYSFITILKGAYSYYTLLRE